MVLIIERGFMEIISSIKLALVACIPLMLALTVREVARGWAARKLGDRYTIRSYNPLDYIDKMGTLLFPLMSILLTNTLMLFAWCRPAIINVSNIQKKRDRIILYLSGSIANLLMIIGWLLVSIIVLIMKVKFSVMESTLWDLLLLVSSTGIKLNMIILSFNLFPLLPFDGGKIVEEFLPRDIAINFRKIEQYSTYIMIFIVFFTPLMRLWMGYMNQFIELSVLLPIMNLIS